MTGFADKNVIAELTAKMLIEVEAVRFMTDKLIRLGEPGFTPTAAG